MADHGTLIALLPVKENSHRIPDKNFRDFLGQPLYFHIVRTLQSLDVVCEIAINTDSPRVMTEAPSHFNKVRVIDRPPFLRGDEISMNRIIEYDLSQITGDLYLQTHATNPLLRPSTIERAVQAFRNERVHDSLFGVNCFRTRFYDHDGQAINHDPANLIPTQDLAPLYEENSCIYLFTKESFATTGARIGARPLMFETPRGESIDIDDEESWRIAEALSTARLK